MPKIRPGWTPKQSIQFRLAAIHFLSLDDADWQDYLDGFFQEWLMAYGMPAALEGTNIRTAIALYKKVSKHSPGCWSLLLNLLFACSARL
jgi:hypothetical protein